ncbi:hypothetical protein FRC12_018356 [Ceratobasidium sp. 428]|nr:hypothetical protein FRC12_018356 [Ceratobasidium sp. 428]
MAHTQKLNWEAFHNTIDTVTTDHWATLSLEPQAVDGKTTSANALRPLTPGDLSSLTEDVKKNRSLGQGRIKMPWYWRVNYAPSVNDTGDVTLCKSEMAEECSASIRVEWFRGRERYKRWEEEVFWLEREAASCNVFSHENIGVEAEGL